MNGTQPWIGDQPAAAFAAYMSGGAVGAGCGGGCAGDDSCSTCGMKRSDPTHQRLEWAKFVGENSGGNLFWQTAQAANAFFGQDGAAGLDPRVAASVRLTQQVVSNDGAGIGSRWGVPPGWSQQESEESRWTGFSGSRPGKRPPLRPPVTTVRDDDGPLLSATGAGPYVSKVLTFDPINRLCCCVAHGIVVRIQVDRPSKAGKYYLHIEITFHFMYVLGLEAGPCKIELWELTSPDPGRKDATGKPIDEEGWWTEVATSIAKAGEKSVASLYEGAVSDEFVCPGYGSFRWVDEPSSDVPFYLEQRIRQLSGCPGGASDEVTVKVVAVGEHVYTDPPPGPEVGGEEQLGPRLEAPATSGPPEFSDPPPFWTRNDTGGFTPRSSRFTGPAGR